MERLIVVQALWGRTEASGTGGVTRGRTDETTSGTTGSDTGTQDRTEASGTTDSTTDSQDRTDVRQARASRREEHKLRCQKGKEKLRPEEGVEARRMTRSIAKGNSTAVMMMTNALTGSEGGPLTYREATEAPRKRTGSRPSKKDMKP